jgi:hypothetical protein
MSDLLRLVLEGELRKAQAELTTAMAEWDRLIKKQSEAHPRHPNSKKKSGRPTIWKGLTGLQLVEAVEVLQTKREQCPKDYEDYPDGWKGRFAGRHSLAWVIRWVVKNHPILRKNKTILRLSDRALQARYQQAADCWSEVRRNALDAEIKTAHERLRATVNRVSALDDKPKARA